MGGSHHHRSTQAGFVTSLFVANDIPGGWSYGSPCSRCGYNSSLDTSNDHVEFWEPGANYMRGYVWWFGEKKSICTIPKHPHIYVLACPRASKRNASNGTSNDFCFFCRFVCVCAPQYRKATRMPHPGPSLHTWRAPFTQPGTNTSQASGSNAKCMVTNSVPTHDDRSRTLHVCAQCASEPGWTGHREGGACRRAQYGCGCA